METSPKRSMPLPTQLLSVNRRADLYYWNAPCNIWFVALFMYTAATFLSLCTSCSGCTITLWLLHAFLVYSGRSDKKDSCGALYFGEGGKKESVICLNRKHSAPVPVLLLILETYLLQAGSYSFPCKTLWILYNSLREKDHFHSASRAWLFCQIRRRELLWIRARSGLCILSDC